MFLQLGTESAGQIKKKRKRKKNRVQGSYHRVSWSEGLFFTYEGQHVGGEQVCLSAVNSSLVFAPTSLNYIDHLYATAEDLLSDGKANVL